MMQGEVQSEMELRLGRTNGLYDAIGASCAQTVLPDGDSTAMQEPQWESIAFRIRQEPISNGQRLILSMVNWPDIRQQHTNSEVAQYWEVYLVVGLGTLSSSWT